MKTAGARDNRAAERAARTLDKLAAVRAVGVVPGRLTRTLPHVIHTVREGCNAFERSLHVLKVIISLYQGNTPLSSNHSGNTSAIQIR